MERVSSLDVSESDGVAVASIRASPSFPSDDDATDTSHRRFPIPQFTTVTIHPLLDLIMKLNLNTGNMGYTSGGVGKSGVLEAGAQKRHYLWNA